MLTEYKKRPDPSTFVTAIKLDFDFASLVYTKWGGRQIAEQGDYLLNNNGSVYTCDGHTFENTYEEVSPFTYRKVTSVWAVRAETDGWISTQEGDTEYSEGDMLVYNNQDETDGYAMSYTQFHDMYIPA